MGVQWPALFPGLQVDAGDLILVTAKLDVSPEVTCRFKAWLGRKRGVIPNPFQEILFLWSYFSSIPFLSAHVS